MLREYRLRLTVEAPVVSRGVSVVRLGVDVPILREPGGLPHLGRPILPKDQVRGMLRHAMSDLEGDGFATRWFGDESPDASAVRRLHVTDLVAVTPACEMPEITRIAIDETTGSVATGQLLTIEQCWPVGSEVRFEGRLWIENPDDEIVPAIETALAMIPAIGAMKSVGFGQIVEVEPLADITPAQRSASGLPTGGAATLSLHPLEPFCVDSELQDGNIFRGRTVIPGGTLKGMIARNLKNDPAVWQSIEAEFHKFRFRHARPVRGRRPPALTPPLSLVECDGHIFDCMETEPPKSSKLSAYQIDWKDKVKKRLPKRYRAVELESDMRVHVGIEAARFTVRDEQLFSVRSVVADDETRWQSRIEAGGGDPKAFSALLQALAYRRMVALGAQDTTVDLEIDDPQPQPVTPGIGETRAILCLETPALLTDRTELEQNGWDVERCYQRYFKAEHGIELKQFFSAEELRGGYIATRYPPQALREDATVTYEPYILTMPGSVFELSFKEDRRQTVESWLNSGLSLSKRHRGKWTNCPFVPENGYGEVRLVKPGEHREGDGHE